MIVIPTASDKSLVNKKNLLRFTNINELTFQTFKWSSYSIKLKNRCSCTDLQHRHVISLCVAPLCCCSLFVCLFVLQPNWVCYRLLPYCQSGLKISFKNTEKEYEQGENDPNPNNGGKTQGSRREGAEPRHCYGSQRKG